MASHLTICIVNIETDSLKKNDGTLMDHSEYESFLIVKLSEKESPSQEDIDLLSSSFYFICLVC